jgi:hypothetical protein
LGKAVTRATVIAFSGALLLSLVEASSAVAKPDAKIPAIWDITIAQLTTHWLATRRPAPK